MGTPQATWLPEGRLFLWAPSGRTRESLARDLPSLSPLAWTPEHQVLAVPQDGAPARRTRLEGVSAGVADLLGPLAALPRDAIVSDSVRVWSKAALLALDLAARHRVFPTTREGQACWRALLDQPEDRRRAEQLAASLPTIARARPALDRGALVIHTSAHVLRGFLDAAVDAIYRRDARPGATRGWTLEFAEALRGADRAFAPRDARDRGIPDRIADWAEDVDRADARLVFALGLPNGKDDRFPLSLRLVREGGEEGVSEAWKRGRGITVAVRGLARACKLHAPLAACLEGEVPKDLRLSPDQAATFLEVGAPALRDAGFEVRLPPEFERAGRRRLHARLRLLKPDGNDLSGRMPCRWEIVLGDEVLFGDDVTRLQKAKSPLVRFGDGWVCVDRREAERLPAPTSATLPSIEGLRAAFLGEHDGWPVVIDPALEALLATISAPEEVRPKLEATLRPYQAHGVAWLGALGRLGLGACLADDMGLGKTIQLIGHLAGRLGPSLVVCPTSVLGNWVREIRRFAPYLRIRRYYGPDRSLHGVSPGEVVLTTYGVLVRDEEELRQVAWDVVTLDEAQSIKNADAQRARVARSLPGRHRIALSGTPLENRLEELWSLFEFVVPGLLGGRAQFRRDVAMPIERFNDNAAADRLKKTLGPFLLRRRKADPGVAEDLPDKLETLQWCSLTPEQARLYEQVVEEEMERIAEASKRDRRGRVLALLTKLKQVCNHPTQLLEDEGGLEGRSGKMGRCEDLVESFLDRGDRALIFTQYRVMGELLRRRFQERFDLSVPFLHGGVPQADRDEMVNAFSAENGPPVLLVSLRAGGTGLNLARATQVVHYDRWWNPAVEDQATDRAWRIGQVRDVHVHKLVCTDTLEERIDRLLEGKRALAEQVVVSGPGDLAALDDLELRHLVALGADAVVSE
jgi:hypothetical protein